MQTEPYEVTEPRKRSFNNSRQKAFNLNVYR